MVTMEHCQLTFLLLLSDRETAKQLAGDQYDEALFGALSIPVVTKQVFEAAFSVPTIDELTSCKVSVMELLEHAKCGPLMIRAAWHDSGTYDDSIGISSWPKCGGANG